MSTARIDELRSKFDENPRRYFAPLANEYRKAGELSQAIALCREHLPKQPGHMSGHIVFGQALFEGGELSEAQTVFQAALDLDPENLIALRHLGDIARARGDDPLARRWYERVLDADPRNDDISALLSTLTGRLTPPTMTPVSAAAIPADSPALDLDAMSETDNADDPFSAPDSPAWHTPSFLTPLASAAVVPDVPDVPGETDIPDMTNVSHLSDESYESDMSDVSDAIHAAAAEHAHELDVAARQSDDLLDLDFAADDNTAAEYGAIVEGATEVNAGEAFTVIDEEAVEPADVLSAALGAFASHDLEDEVADTVPAAEYDAAPQRDEATLPIASYDDEDTFEDELEVQGWPDAHALTARVFTPSHGELPIVLDTYDDVPLVLPVESSMEGDVEAMATFSMEADVDAMAPSSAEADVEAMVTAGGEADVEAELDDDVLVSLDDTVPVIAEIDDVNDFGDEDIVMQDEDAPVPEAAPAFVTETMAELLVAQGFVGRAVEVYDELVARRPSDAVLAFRLQELRDMLADEQVAEQWVEEEQVSKTVVEAELDEPVHEVTPAPAAATISRRSAREMFASLATMRVVRRTPAYGSTTVAMPTPADGLASLFGESQTGSDDLTARAMARAFGSGEGVEAGPSMFAPSIDADAPRSRPTPAAVPPVPSGPAFSFDRFFPDPATASTSAQATDDSGASQAPESAVASGSGEAAAAGPSSAGADLAHFSQWLKGLSNS